jgi:CrcB protein
MSGWAIVAVGTGAAVGAWLRWALGIWLNSLLLSVPPGTLLANLIGGYVIGGAIAFFSHAPGVAPEWRLLIVTGFCGGLTTFSTFSIEIASLLQQGRMGVLAGAIALHVGGSLLMTLLGITTVQWFCAR